LCDLDLDTCEITAKGVRTLAEAPWFGGLGRLNLNHNSAGADGAFALMKGCASDHLFELHLCDNDLDTEALTLLADSSTLCGLQTLDLSENALDAETLAALSVSPHLTQLRELHLNHCTLGTRGIQSLRGAPWLANLVRLSLSDNAIGDEGLKTLLGKSGLAQLNDLAVHSCSLSAVSAIVLADAELTELHRLDISANKLGGIAVEPLVRSPLAACLVELDLSGNAIDDPAIIALAALEWPLLRTLRLEANQITDKGALALSKARFMPRLREVHCRNNRIEWRTFQQLGPRFRQY
jgi:Leucine-rich repeat (LRR) protein